MKRTTIFNKAGLFLATLLVVACTDTTAPMDEIALRERIQREDAPVTTITQADNAPALEMYRSSFEAIQGSRTTFTVHYENGDRFIQLEISADAQFVGANGLPARHGETVTVTVEIHPTLFWFAWMQTVSPSRVNVWRHSRFFQTTRMTTATRD